MPAPRAERLLSVPAVMPAPPRLPCSPPPAPPPASIPGPFARPAAVIRVLGGLLSLYNLTDDRLFLDKAIVLGDRLLPALKAPGACCARGGGRQRRQRQTRARHGVLHSSSRGGVPA